MAEGGRQLQDRSAVADEALDPALLRFIQALARTHVDEDYAAAQAATAAPTQSR